MERGIFDGRSRNVCIRRVISNAGVWLSGDQRGFARNDRSIRCFRWMKSLIQVRNSSQVFGRGSIEFLHPSNHRVLAYVRQFDEENVLVVNNLSSSAQAVELDVRDYQRKYADRDVRQKSVSAIWRIALFIDAGALPILLVSATPNLSSLEVEY